MAEQDRPRARIVRESTDPAAGDARRPGSASDRSAGAAGRGPGARDAGRERATGTRERGREASKVPWVALAVAAILGLWQIIYALTISTVAEASQDVYTSVSLFISVILAVGAAVLGTVALSQHRRPRWPATAAVAVGVYVFAVGVASWIGSLMASPV